VIHVLSLGGFSISRLAHRLLGITGARLHFVMTTGIPLTKRALEHRIGSRILRIFIPYNM
jgi:hypothetical protein